MDERPFIVMELITEGSLSERLKETGRFDWHQVQSIGIKIADALSRAHEVGVLHRDIKPANILMVGDEPKLTDFGIASFLDSTGATSTNIAVSWSHAPPETFENVRDERSDVYSLGSTLHTLLTGAPPFFREGETSINPLLNRLLNEEPPAIARPDVPHGLRSLILETLRKDPNDRPQTAALMSRRLGEIKQGPQMGAANTVPFTTGTPSDTSATAELRSIALQPGGDDKGQLSNASRGVGTGPRGQRWKVNTLVAVALLASLAVAGSAEFLWRDRVDDRTSDAEVAGPLAAEIPASSTTDNVASSTLTQPTQSTALLTTSEAAEETSSTSADVISRPLTQPAESTAVSTTSEATEETSSTALPTTAATINGTTTSNQPSSSSTSAPALSAPNVRLREVSETSLWVQWDPVDSGFWYPYRVTVDGEEVESVDTSSAVASYHGPRRGNTCIHVKAQNQARTSSSPEGTFCHDTSTG